MTHLPLSMVLRAEGVGIRSPCSTGCGGSGVACVWATLGAVGDVSLFFVCFGEGSAESIACTPSENALAEQLGLAFAVARSWRVVFRALRPNHVHLVLE